MRSKVVAIGISLVALGGVLAFSGFILNTYNRGSCPFIPEVGPLVCDHMMTLGGVTFWIGATSAALEVIGTIVLVSGLVIYISQASKRKEQM